MESALRAQRSRESRRKPERVLLLRRPIGAQIVRKSRIKGNAFWTVNSTAFRFRSNSSSTSPSLISVIGEKRTAARISDDYVQMSAYLLHSLINRGLGLPSAFYHFAFETGSLRGPNRNAPSCLPRASRSAKSKSEVSRNEEFGRLHSEERLAQEQKTPTILDHVANLFREWHLALGVLKSTF